jgi:hypothetical protein
MSGTESLSDKGWIQQSRITARFVFIPSFLEKKLTQFDYRMFLRGGVASNR